MPGSNDISRLRDDPSHEFDAFSHEIRQRMQDLMQEIESDFGDFLDTLLRVRVADFESRAASLLGADPGLDVGARVANSFSDGLASVFGGNSGSILGRGLGAALSSALGQLARRRKVNVRTIVRDAGRAAAAPPRGMRLSRAQLSLQMLGELNRSQRNG